MIFRSSNKSSDEYTSIINKFTKSANLIHLEQSGDGQSIKLNYDAVLINDIDPEEIIRELAKIESLSEISLVASKHDIDY